MIEFVTQCSDIPYAIFKKKYDEALNADQKNVEAIAISSYDKALNEVNSRFVNLKIIDDKEFIFFSNYMSPKSNEFKEHNQVTVLIFWNTINLQIRIKALIKKTSKEFNKNYFVNRSEKKNALAISSYQSMQIDSYSNVVTNYNKALKLNSLKECPDYWGGYSFNPYYFEFWEGHESRLNKRDLYQLNNGEWHHSILQP